MGQHQSQQSRRDRAAQESILVDISWVASNRRDKERRRSLVIDDDAVVLFGSTSNVQQITALLNERFSLSTSGVEMVDSRAKYLVVLRSLGKYWALPAPEPFSRHCGICLIVGDRKARTSPVKLQLGCCLRLGSVGLVVSEICGKDGQLHTLSQEHIQYLKEGADIWHGDEEDEAKLAQDDVTCFEDDLSVGDCDSSLSERVEQHLCYMCYDATDTPENPLVAPCDCKGDTRFVHMQCLQKWYSSSTSSKAHVVRISATGTTACKVCGAPYKTTVRMPDGRKTHLLESVPEGAYVSLIVVTRHDTAPTLFSTKFRLSFGRREEFTQEDVTSLTIGRSSSCDVVLDYRTVSTTHARIYTQGDDFYLVDLNSSNGTMMYIRTPVELPYGRTTRLRVGRSTVAVTPRRTWRARLTSPSTSRGNSVDFASRVMQAVMEATPARRSTAGSGDASPLRTQSLPSSQQPEFFRRQDPDIEDEKEQEIISPTLPVVEAGGRNELI